MLNQFVEHFVVDWLPFLAIVEPQVASFHYQIAQLVGSIVAIIVANHFRSKTRYFDNELDFTIEEILMHL